MRGSALQVIKPVTEALPDDIERDLEKACALHQRAVSDYKQCEEFSRLMSDLLARLEDAGCFETADKVMTDSPRLQSKDRRPLREIDHRWPDNQKTQLKWFLGH